MSAKLFLSPVRDGRGQISNLNFDILTYYSLVRNVTNSSPSPPVIMVKLENVEFQFVDSPLLLLKYCNETGECQVQGQDAGPGGLVEETKLYV